MLIHAIGMASSSHTRDSDFARRSSSETGAFNAPIRRASAETSATNGNSADPIVNKRIGDVAISATIRLKEIDNFKTWD